LCWGVTGVGSAVVGIDIGVVLGGECTAVKCKKEIPLYKKLYAMVTLLVATGYVQAVVLC